jgi:hypothetical protein
MGLIQTDVAGLLALAAHCEAQAGRIAAISTASAATDGFQPSALAVQAARAEVAAAGTRLAARMTATAVAASTPAGNYGASDTTNAAEITAVGTVVV